ncbi:thiamine/thiamine pyrophosphate ABC transporter permease ThiP [Tabrizicola piscis]|uniref:Thiamine/thiamine pyrophosphate ABC transporter permease ThiP n=1 Tax=Tabrizicola piscis TaxID=2494374 RepID=A0A3S8U6H4_9RHOB|nr:thiamine/thiamine pyrophosphate ABC transporter permease ThiP [Tabrizicola piscis]AZL59155.1 thiamine/thiamine pyrophosphate ABC transporter permease ThiP [Tabrizicola piscis]
MTRAVPSIIALCLLALVIAPLVAVALRGAGVSLGPADWAAVRFTVTQAVLSALISTVLAIPVARALARRRFFGRGALVTLMGAPFLLPAVVAVLGLLAVFGRSGLLNSGLAALGLPPVSIFGLQGVLLAHVFLNLPLAVRMILQGWLAIPAERFRLAQSLGFGPAQMLRHLEAPMLREVVPGVALVILVICLTSFAVVLTLGGGPAATTIELAIYQAVRFDFDLARAAGLAGVQVVICALAALAAWVLMRPAGFGAGLDRQAQIPAPGGWRSMADGATLAAATLFLILPLLAVALRGVPGLADLPPSVLPAALRSVLVALASATLTSAAALALALAVARKPSVLAGAAATLPLATSGLVLGTGLFLIVQPFTPPMTVALPVTILVNMALTLPYLYRILLPQARALRSDYGRLADSLGLQGWSRLRWLILPRLARPLGFGAGIAAALSMGDLGAIALFAGERQATLPLVVQQLTGAYRLEAASAASLVLVTLSFALFWACDAGGRRAAA